MQNYGNHSSTLNTLRMRLGNQSISGKSDPYCDKDKSDCITCQIRKTNRLPLNHQAKVNDLCKQICKPTLKDMGDKVCLTDYTRPQLMVKYPNLGLHVRMDKPTMIQIIEVHLLQQELFGDNEATDLNHVIC